MATSYDYENTLTKLARKLMTTDAQASALALILKGKLRTARRQRKLREVMPQIKRFVAMHSDEAPSVTRPRIRHNAGRPTELSRPIGYKAKK